MCTPRAALGAEVLVVGAGDGGAVGLVGAVGAVLVAVAVVRGRDAERVAAAELADVTCWETWKWICLCEIGFVEKIKTTGIPFMDAMF